MSERKQGVVVMKKQRFNVSIFLEFASVGLVVSVGCALIALFLGRDLNWDYFNYHDYAAFSSQQDRLRQDFFAAGYQGYLTPLPFRLFGWLVSLELHSAFVALIVAFFQSANLFAVYLVAKELVGVRGWGGSLVSFLLVVLGSLSGVFLGQLGSTFVDPLAAIPIMMALWIVLKTSEIWWVCVACFFVGCSVALKLTNSVFAAGVFVSILVGMRKDNAILFLRSGFCFGLSAVFGFLLLYSWWGWKLFSEFGSPLFPLFNNVFKSQWFPEESIAYYRFIPNGFVEALLLPLAMLKHESWIYAEIAAPDARPAALVIVAFSLLIVMVFRLVRPSAYKGPCSGDKARPRLIECKFWAFFLTSTLFWLATSGNGRYAVPLFLTMGVGFYVLLERLLPFRYTILGVILLVVVQLQIVIAAGNPRWNPMQWTPEWLSADVPRELTTDPVLVLSIGSSSESYLVRHLHPDSAFVNPIGLISIPNDGERWKRFLELRQRFLNDIYVVFPVKDGRLKASSLDQNVVSRYEVAADRLGVGFVGDGCRVMSFNGEQGSALIFNDFLRPPAVRRLAYCKAAVIKPSELLAGKRAFARKIMDAFERECPKYLKPSSPQVEGGEDVWTRFYGKYDITMGVSFRTGEIYYYQERQGVDSLIGSVDTWESDVDSFRCELPFDGRRDTTTLSSHAVY